MAFFKFYFSENPLRKILKNYMVQLKKKHSNKVIYNLPQNQPKIDNKLFEIKIRIRILLKTIAGKCKIAVKKSLF